MKRAVSIVLILSVLMGINFAYAAGGSIDILSQYWSDPPMPFELLERSPSWPSLYKTIDDKYHLADLVGEQYQLDEALLITVDNNYRRVTWHFPSDFTGLKQISVLLIRKDMMYANLMSARAQKDGSIQMNFVVLAQGEYYMLVFAVR